MGAAYRIVARSRIRRKAASKRQSDGLLQRGIAEPNHQQLHHLRGGMKTNPRRDREGKRTGANRGWSEGSYDRADVARNGLQAH